MSHGGIRSVPERDGHRSDAVAAAEVVSRSLSSMVTWRTQNQQDPEDAHGREVPAFCCKLSLPESSEQRQSYSQLESLYCWTAAVQGPYPNHAARGSPFFVLCVQTAS